MFSLCAHGTIQSLITECDVILNIIPLKHLEVDLHVW